MTKHEIKIKIDSLLDELYTKSREMYVGINIERIKVEYSLSGRTAGMFTFFSANLVPSKMKLKFNLPLADANPNTYWDTIAHEFSHYICMITFGLKARPHGPEWQQIMRHFGYEPSRTHSYKMPESYIKSKTPFKYACKCMDHMFSSKKHANAQYDVYICKKCKNSLEFICDIRDGAIDTPKSIPGIFPLPNINNADMDTFDVKDISILTGFDTKKVRRILRKNELTLPKRYGKSWVFNINDKNIVMRVF